MKINNYLTKGKIEDLITSNIKEFPSYKEFKQNQIILIVLIQLLLAVFLSVFLELNNVSLTVILWVVFILITFGTLPWVRWKKRFTESASEKIIELLKKSGESELKREYVFESDFFYIKDQFHEFKASYDYVKKYKFEDKFILIYFYVGSPLIIDLSETEKGSLSTLKKVLEDNFREI